VAVNPSSASTIALAPGSLSLAPTQGAAVTATVRDPQGNPIAGFGLTFYLGGPGVAGTLESAGATSGGPGSQSGVTDASGQLAVRYRAPSAAPAADSIFASGGALAVAGIRAVTSPGPTAALRVTPAAVSWTAGQPESVRVEAIDAFGNLVTSDAAVVTMRAAGASSRSRATRWPSRSRSPPTGREEAWDRAARSRSDLRRPPARSRSSRRGTASPRTAGAPPP
jgi:hypothetical protein